MGSCASQNTVVKPPVLVVHRPKAKIALKDIKKNQLFQKRAARINSQIKIDPTKEQVYSSQPMAKRNSLNPSMGDTSDLNQTHYSDVKSGCDPKVLVAA